MSEEKLVIGVTDCSKYERYRDWILEQHSTVEVKQLKAGVSTSDDIKNCKGIVLTGGEDVHPRFYNRPELYEYCYKDDVSEERDDFELSVLKQVEAEGIPLLGICRGLQITNVYFGGTLIPDIPSWGKFNHSKFPDNTDRYHVVQVDPNSALHRIVLQEQGQINSNHHQSADRIGNGLVVSALSPDGVVEALEMMGKGSDSFWCLVQWHPERMTDQQSNFAKNLRDAFYEACLR